MRCKVECDMCRMETLSQHTLLTTHLPINFVDFIGSSLICWETARRRHAVTAGEFAVFHSTQEKDVLWPN
jgi:hypothetical protein